MFLRVVRGLIVGALVAAVAVPACSSSSDSPAASGGSGGASGAAGAATGRGGGAGSVSAETKTCGAKTCTGVLIPQASNFAIPPCCPTDTSVNQCGLDSAFLSMFGPTFSEECQPLAQPGTPDPSCPDSPKSAVQGTALTISFPGCCRANRTCGYQLDTIGGLIRLGLGCVDSTPFLDGGTPAACGDIAGEGGAGGQGGNPSGAGAPGSAGESATGGVAGG